MRKRIKKGDIARSRILAIIFIFFVIIFVIFANVFKKQFGKNSSSATSTIEEETNPRQEETIFLN